MNLPGPVPVPVVFGVNVLVLAVAAGESPFRSWPAPPPTSGNPSADCVGVINDAAEFALWLSPHILANTGRVLATVLKTPDEEVDEYLRALAEMAGASGGGAEVVEIADRREAIRHAVAWAGPDDAVLVAGKGHETGQSGGGHTRPFDDRVELAQALADLDGAHKAPQ